MDFNIIVNNNESNNNDETNVSTEDINIIVKLL